MVLVLASMLLLLLLLLSSSAAAAVAAASSSSSYVVLIWEGKLFSYLTDYVDISHLFTSNNLPSVQVQYII